jgi:nucleoside-diphosphate-sugar epimerase
MKEELNVLLTGASGSVGKAVLKELINRKKYTVTVFDLDNKKSKKELFPFRKEIRIVYGDISSYDQIASAASNQDVVIHLAGIIPPLAEEHEELCRKVNILGTQNLILALESLSPKAFLLYSSSVSIYGDRLQDPLIVVKDKINPGNIDYYAFT